MLQPQAIPISFAKGVDNKNDPFQIPIGSFLNLVNSVFTIGNRLTKRNGYGLLAPLPIEAAFCTTFNGDLTAVSTSIQAYSAGNQTWVSKGTIQPLTLSTLPLIRNNLNQTQSDSVVSANGYVCTAYTENNGSTNAFKYVVADSVTGQNIVAPTVISGADATLGTPKVYLLGGYFIIIYSSSSTHLAFIAVSTNTPSLVTSQALISTTYIASATVSFDAVTFSNSLYVAWGNTGTVRMATLSPNLFVSASKIIDASHTATLMSVCVDNINSIIYANYYNSVSSTGYSAAVDVNMVVQANFPADIITTGTINNLASVAKSGVATVFYETAHTASGVSANFVSSVTVTQSSGAVGAPIVVLRSVGLASKAFLVDSVAYFLAIYASSTSSVIAYQPTYFLVNGSASTSAAPIVIAKLAYENGGGYYTTGVPNISVYGSTAYISYLYKDLIEALNDANESGTIVQGGIYSQTGINLVSFVFGSQGLATSEIGSNLNISGTGFLTMYDGYLPVENNFHVYPDNVQNTATATTGGHLSAQIYYYQVTYEWADNQGNVFRSAGSIPTIADIHSSGTSTNTNTLVIPTLRITAKTANPAKIMIYRWSTAQPVFYRITSIAAPILNSTTTDSVTYVDTLADSSIVGNDILYTTGGVIEDVGAPSSSAMTLFDDRLWIADAEDQNLLWFSKQVIEATPVEMSDLLTKYIAPTIGATGPTGPVTALSAMDDKLLIFKRNAMYYINGSGPDNTGANDQYSQPTFITSMVGCSNQNSIVFQPSGLMFEYATEAGNQIWILGRDLSTQYIGSAVEPLTLGATVLSSIAAPGTNEVRFNMSSGITLKYDYFYGQWGTHTTNAVSSTLYQDLHTYIAPSGSVFQETPGKYLDGSTPVLMSFLTGHIQLSGISGYQRIWEIQLLGQYYSPHLLNVQMGYDFATLSEQAQIQPTNFTGVYGSDQLYGQTSPFGGPGLLEQWRIQPATELCQAFQLSIQEAYDPSYNTAAGEGFTLSAFTCLIGVQRGYRPVKAAATVGTS